MKITVITICLNSEKTIERTIRSVLNQDWENKEYIIIDGKSSDNTMNIIKNYKQNIQKLISEKDGGIYEAMNKGLVHAKGDVVCFLNSDDFYTSKHVLTRVADTMINNNLDAIFGGVNFYKKGIPQKIIRTYLYHNFSLDKFSYGWMPAHPASFIKNDIIKKIGLFNTKYRIAGDFDYLLRIFQIKKFNFICIPEIFVSMQSGGISNINLKSKVIINKEILESCRRNGIKTNLLKINFRFFKKFLEYL